MQFSYDRVVGFVRLAARGRLRNEAEIEEAVSEALMRLYRRMSETFEGTTMGEYVMATKQLCEFAVRDVHRSAAIRAKHEAGSIDDVYADDEGNETGRFAAPLQKAAERRADLAEDALEAASVLAEYLPRCRERSRIVLEHMRDGVPVTESTAILDVSEANLYQLRTRAIKEIRALIESDAA